MLTTTATNFKKKMDSMLENVIKHNEPLAVMTKDGNAVILSEGDYRGLMETLHLCSIPGMKESILEAANETALECASEKEVW